MGQYVSNVHYVQCKTDKKYMSLNERVELVNYSLKYGARAVLAYKDSKRHIKTEFLH